MLCVRWRCGVGVACFARCRVSVWRVARVRIATLLKRTAVLSAPGGGASLFGRKSWKKRYFVLKDGFLSYSEDRDTEVRCRELVTRSNPPELGNNSCCRAHDKQRQTGAGRD